MKLSFPINNNTISLIIVTIITVMFFICAAFGVLEYIIVKVLLITLTTSLGVIVAVILFKKSLIKNRPEDELRDDFN